MRNSVLTGKLKISLAVTIFLSLLSATVALGQSVVATIPVPGSPTGVAVNPHTKRVYVAVGFEVAVINESTNTVIGTISVPAGNQNIVDVAVNPVTSRLYVAAENYAMYVIDTNTNNVVATVAMPAVTMAVNLYTNKIYVSDFEANVTCSPLSERT